MSEYESLELSATCAENERLCREICGLKETIKRQQAALNEIKQVLSGVLEQRPILDEDRSDLEHALDLAEVGISKMETGESNDL